MGRVSALQSALDARERGDSFGSQRVRSREATRLGRAGAARGTTRRRPKSRTACLACDAERAARVSPVDSRRARGQPAVPVARGTRVDSIFRTRWKSKMARQNARVGGCRRRRERTSTARRRLPPSSTIFPTRAAPRVPEEDTHREWPTRSGGSAYTTLRYHSSERFMLYCGDFFREDRFARESLFHRGP